MNKKVVTSIIIPVYNGAKTIADCLQSIHWSEYKNYEVIVVDDGSTDGTIDQIKEFDCQIIRMGKNQGPAAARNKGAQNAQGELLFFLDADITIETDTLNRIQEVFQKEPEISALFCAYQKETPVKSFYSKYKNLLHHYTHQISKEEAATFCGGFGAIKKKVFLDFEGFNPDYRFLEDVELGYRFYQAGRRILLKKEIQMTHHKSYSFWGLIKSDVFGRAIPWTKLMLEKQIFRGDLNTRIENILSVPISYGILLFFPISLFWLNGLWILLGLVLFFLIMNQRFFTFILKEKGIIFLMKSIPLNWFGYLYSGMGLILGVFSFLKGLTGRAK